jgi:hypothetical protein
MMVLARPIIGTLYGSKWLAAPWFMVLSVASNLLAVFGYLAIQSLLTGLGETKLLMKLNLLAISIGVPLGFLLIPLFGVVGVIFSAFVAILPGLMISLYFVWKRYEVSVDFRVSSRILLASVIAALAAYGLVSVLNVAMWSQLVNGLLAFVGVNLSSAPLVLNLATGLQFVSGLLVLVGVYLFSAPLVGAISLMDISNLRAMVSGLGLVSRVLRVPLSIMERSLKIRGSRAQVRTE